jgi:hypothetical protein
MVIYPITLLMNIDPKIISKLGLAPTPSNFQPVPIHVGNIDQMMRGMDTDICPYQSVLRKRFAKTGEWKEINEKYQKILFSEMIQKWNANEDVNFNTAYQYIDNYYSSWFDQMDVAQLSSEGQDEVDQILRDGLYEGFFGLDLAIRLATTRFFDFLSNTIERKISALSGFDDVPEFYKRIKYMYLSAHDSTLSAIMSGLQQKQDDQVRFASNLRIEVYRKTNFDINDPEGYDVKMLYNEKFIHIGSNETCAEYDCPFDVVKKFLDSRKYDGDLELICNKTDSSKGSSTWMYILLATAILIVILNIIYFVLKGLIVKRGSKNGYVDIENPKVALNKSNNSYSDISRE